MISPISSPSHIKFSRFLFSTYPRKLLGKTLVVLVNYINRPTHMYCIHSISTSIISLKHVVCRLFITNIFVGLHPCLSLAIPCSFSTTVLRCPELCRQYSSLDTHSLPATCSFSLLELLVSSPRSNSYDIFMRMWKWIECCIDDVLYLYRSPHLNPWEL